MTQWFIPPERWNKTARRITWILWLIGLVWVFNLGVAVFSTASGGTTSNWGVVVLFPAVVYIWWQRLSWIKQASEREHPDEWWAGTVASTSLLTRTIDVAHPQPARLSTFRLDGKQRKFRTGDQVQLQLYHVKGKTVAAVRNEGTHDTMIASTKPV